MGNIPFIMRRTIWFYISLLCLVMMSTTVASAEIQDGVVARKQLITEVRTLLHQGMYNELENMAHKFRTEKTRFPDGGWKLHTFYDGVNDTYYGRNDLLSNLEKWMKNYPGSITARVAAGKAWFTFAWDARGSGYANTVKEEEWKLMRERMAKAFDFIKEAPDDPSKDCIERYNLLLEMANTLGWDREEYETLFQKAISFEPLYYSYYLTKAYYLLPRWHGEDGEWQRYANEAVKLIPRSEGMGIYTRILIMAWSANEFREFREPDISWKKMRQGFRDIERLYPDSKSMLNGFCKFACIAGDKDTARELFKRIGDDPYIEVWEGRSKFVKWQRWAGVLK